MLKDYIDQTVTKHLLHEKELNRLFGNGITAGSVSLIGGQPGVGKTTLLLTIAAELSMIGKVLFVSGEESIGQIKSRFKNLNFNTENLLFFANTNIEQIINVLNDNYQFLFIDSIQMIDTLEVGTSRGSLAQIKACTLKIMELCKKDNITAFLIGHITKNGEIAGPKVIEHMVDTVLYFEGDTKSSYKVLRTTKNRFGKVNEIAIFELSDGFAKIIKNSANPFINDIDDNNGVISVIVEGSRSFLIEVEALTTKTIFGHPKRVTIGIEQARVNLILAVLESHCKIITQNKDIFIKVNGNLKITDNAIDLALAMAVASSICNKPLSKKVCFIGQITLNGKIKAVNYINERCLSATQIGIKKIYSPNLPDQKFSCDIKQITSLAEVIKWELGN